MAERSNALDSSMRVVLSLQMRDERSNGLAPSQVQTKGDVSSPLAPPDNPALQDCLRYA